MSKFKNYLYNLIDNPIKNDLLFEGFNKNVIVKKSTYKDASYEWEFDNRKYYLVVGYLDADKVKHICAFKFYDEEGSTERTNKVNKPAMSIFSGAIIAMKYYLDDHPEIELFSISASNKDFGRQHFYECYGIPVIERHIVNYEFVEIIDEKNSKEFIFKKKGSS